MSTVDIQTALPASLPAGSASDVSRLIIDDEDAPVPRPAFQC
ncbi:hypothetical protein [Caballeronia sp. KNU42]